MQIHQIKVKNKKPKRRIGRGGKKGTYSGRGVKGQKSRSGASINPIFEGGRSTLIEHLPKKRGFKSRNPKNQVVNIKDLETKFKDGETVNPQTLRDKGLTSNIKPLVKILGNGEMKMKLFIEKCLVSKSAKEKIEKAGGSVK
jgi:large subunit ribosomal protein L15